MRPPNGKVSDIIKQYEKRLVVYPEKSPRQFFLCPVGPVGSGKTTVARPLAERMHLVLVSSDEIRKILKEKGCGYEKVKDIALSVIEKLAKQGESVVYDADCSNPETKRRMEELASKFKIKLIWIRINPPEEFIIDKLKNFRHTWLFRDSDEAIRNYYASKVRHEKLEKADLKFLYEFDTSKDDLPKQLEEAIALIQSETSSEA